MISLSNNEKIQIMQMLQSPQWQTANQIAETLCNEIAYGSPLRDNEWDTIRAVILQRGQIEGIKRFINELFNQAHQGKI